MELEPRYKVSDSRMANGKRPLGELVLLDNLLARLRQELIYQCNQESPEVEAVNASYFP